MAQKVQPLPWDDSALEPTLWFHVSKPRAYVIDRTQCTVSSIADVMISRASVVDLLFQTLSCVINGSDTACLFVVARRSDAGDFAIRLLLLGPSQTSLF